MRTLGLSFQKNYECTPRLHYDHVKALKQQLRQYRIDPFASCHARDVTIGVELAKNLIKVLLTQILLQTKHTKYLCRRDLLKEKMFF